MKVFVILFALLLSSPSLTAQSIKYFVRGTLQDTTGTGISGATVLLTSDADSISVRTNERGFYSFQEVASSAFKLSLSNLGYQSLEKEYVLDPDNFYIELEPLQLQAQSYELNQILITGKQLLVIKKDTIEYHSRNYKLRENAYTEDLMRLLPGIILGRDGNIIAQGRQISKITVNGRDFFGGDIETVIKNIPANLIEKIQVINDYGDKGRLTGTGDGRAQKIINIKTWANLRKGYFGNANAGIGTEGRYQVSALANYFNNNRETGVYGNLNNNNSNLSGSGYTLKNGGENGLTTLNAFGLNHREKHNKNLTSFGSYNFSNAQNELLSETFRQNIYPDNTKITNNDTSSVESNAYDHLFQWNIEYDRNKVDYIQITPSISYNRKKTGREVDLSQNKLLNSFLADSLRQVTDEEIFNSSPLLGLKVVANHRFAKPGRNIYAEVNVKNGQNTSRQSLNARLNYFDRRGNLSVDSIQRTFHRNANENFSASGRVSYIEPVGNGSRVELGYTYDYSGFLNDRETTRADQRRRIDSLSDKYEYSFMTNTVSLSFRHNGQKHSYALGVSVQPTQLSGESINRNIYVNRNGLNIVPELNYTYTFSSEKSFAFNYAATSNPPSYLQLQPVRDVTNPQYPVTGNPTLKSELWHTVDFSYNSFDFDTGNTLFTNLNASLVQDQVVSNTVLVYQEGNIVTQETFFENVNGGFQLGGIYNASLPLVGRKLILDINGSVNYNNNVSLSNYTRISGKNFVASQNFRMQVNPGGKFELNPSVTYTFNKTAYSIDEYEKNNLSSWALSASGRWNITPSFILGSAFDKNFYNGLAGSVKTNPLILNTYLELQFLKAKKGALRFTGFDLFDQNANVQRMVLNNSIFDNRSNKLGRYFMLLFTLNLNKFET
ncbi:carboxypeptidase family protein [Arcticibacter pallidicorallinus]|uniref:Carboxypeptidase family protein n=1 Tax=Arcticibacter pallidicorallinus TaxID=1259464 RepID=A0A2T0U335_9SPHI|nr:TonB-dependent receptor [Arcticibacter pallidicorallinus]PRY52313.1 carboxypeptidase family protein [Arcticibacter pallidicorallinus]